MEEETAPAFGFIRRNLKRKRTHTAAYATQDLTLAKPQHAKTRSSSSGKASDGGPAPLSKFLTLPSELRQKILFLAIPNKTLRQHTNSNLFFLAISWSNIHPRIRSDMPTVLGDWIRRRAHLSRLRHLSTEVVEEQILDQRRLLALELQRRDHSPQKIRFISNDTNSPRSPDWEHVELSLVSTTSSSPTVPERKASKLYWAERSASARASRSNYRLIALTTHKSERRKVRVGQHP